MSTKTPEQPQLPPDQDQLLDEATTKAKQQAFYMKKALDSGNLREALKASSNMLGELRTSLLSPRNYYNLYMQIFDELKYFESQFIEEQRKGRKMADLYESVQHAGNIIPRLYLLITVASVYIHTHEAPAKEILKDVIEMVKGVQHPMRGLFLRYYLLKTLKDKLPDTGSEFEGEGGDVTDAIEFIIKNLSEMNRLWVRMQHTGIKDKAKREAERNDLRVTVGENIIRLSSLEGVNLELYKSKVLPQILEVIQNCKDNISQQYLMDCIIQAFPDEYHLNTLEIILEACTNLQSSVDIKLIFINLMDRLSQYAGGEGNEIQSVNKDINIFKLFKKYIDKIILDQPNTKLLELQVAFLRFCIKSYPMNTDYVNEILESCVKVIQHQDTAQPLDSAELKNIVKLLSIPLDTLSLAILGMDQYPMLMGHLTLTMRKTVARRIVQAVLKSKKRLNKVDLVERLIEFIRSLVENNPDDTDEPFEFDETMVNVAKLVHLVANKNVITYFNILKIFKKVFLKGGQKRMKYTIPPLVFATFRLTRYANTAGFGQTEEEDEMTKISMPILFQFALELINMYAPTYPETALRLYLQGVLTINEMTEASELDEIGYEYGSQALLVFQDELTDSESKFAAINLIVATFQLLTFFSGDNHDTIMTNTVGYCSKLLKKPDQCRAIIFCTHLFFTPYSKDTGRVLECLKRAGKIANLVVSNPKNLDLLVILINKYIYYLINDKDGEIVNIKDLNALIQETETKLSEYEQTVDMTAVRRFFNATKESIRVKKQTDDKFKGIQV